MTNKLVGAAVAIMAAGMFAATAMAAGPRPSGDGFIAAPASAPVSTYDPTLLGPRASSENHVGPAALTQAAAGAPHRVWEQGYDSKGKWRGHWVTVQ